MTHRGARWPAEAQSRAACGIQSKQEESREPGKCGTPLSPRNRGSHRRPDREERAQALTTGVSPRVVTWKLWELGSAP